MELTYVIRRSPYTKYSIYLRRIIALGGLGWFRFEVRSLWELLVASLQKLPTLDLDTSYSQNRPGTCQAEVRVAERTAVTLPASGP